MPPELTPVVPAGATWIQQWLPLIAVAAAFLAALVAPTLATIMASRIAATNATRAAEAARRVEQKITETTDRTNQKLDRIESMSNGRLTEALKKIQELEARLESLTGRRAIEPPR